jgi:hypothetical protein
MEQEEVQPQTGLLSKQLAPELWKNRYTRREGGISKARRKTETFERQATEVEKRLQFHLEGHG